MTRGLLISASVLCALTVAWMRECSGPKPAIASLSAAHTRAGWTLDATVKNLSPGAGEADVTFRLRDPETHETWKASAPAELDGRGETHARATIDAPPRDLVPSAEVEYPQR